MKEKMEAKTFKVLMFPFLAHGHISPFLELAKKLSSRNFHIFILSTSINLDFIKDSSYRNKDSTTIDLLELHFPPQFDERLPPKLRTTKNLPSHLQPLLMQAFQESRPSFSKVLLDLRPDLVVYDLFQPWSAKIAASEGIPAVNFFTSGSAVASFLHHWHSYGSFEGFPFEEIGFREYEEKGWVGSVKKLKAKGVEEELGFLDGIFELSCDVVLIKSCRGIEGKYMDYLSRLCERKLVPTGPLVKDGGGGGGEDQENGGLEVMEWLEERERGSVLYVSFGSENFLSEKEMAAVAEGLEAAAAVGVGFVWVARAPAGEVVVVSEGFEGRTKGRGVVVRGWAPQAAVLAHRSVGGFMSHCGWSSVTESLYHGVPVVALPLKIDQPANARLVVAAGAGVEVERDGGGGFDGEAVAEAVREVMVGEEREGMRRRAREMSERMRMEEEEAMDGVVEELSRLCMKK